MAGYWPSSFCVFIDRDEKQTRPKSSHLGRTSLVNEGFIIWLKRELFYWTNAENPPRARWAYLPARKANQNAGFPSPCALSDSAILEKNYITLH